MGFPLPLLHSISSYDGRTENQFLGSSLVLTAGSEQNGLFLTSRKKGEGAFITTFASQEVSILVFPILPPPDSDWLGLKCTGKSPFVVLEFISGKTRSRGVLLCSLLLPS